MRTQRDIQRDQFKNDMRGAVCENIKKYPEINQHDIVAALAELIYSESYATIKHYNLVGKNPSQEKEKLLCARCNEEMKPGEALYINDENQIVHSYTHCKEGESLRNYIKEINENV